MLPSANAFCTAFGDASASIDWSTFQVSGDIEITGMQTAYLGANVFDITALETLPGWPSFVKSYTEPGIAQAWGFSDKFIEASTSTTSKADAVVSDVVVQRVLKFTALASGNVSANFDYSFLHSAFKGRGGDFFYLSSGQLEFYIYDEALAHIASLHIQSDIYDPSFGWHLSGNFFETSSGNASLDLFFNEGVSGYIETSLTVSVLNGGDFMAEDPKPHLYRFSPANTTVPEPSTNIMLAAAALIGAMGLKFANKKRNTGSGGGN